MTSDGGFTLETVVLRIVAFCGQRVMPGTDLAVLYGVETGAMVRSCCPACPMHPVPWKSAV